MVALIFILVVGILVTAALSKSGAVLKSDYLVRQQSQLQYAADAGVERALQVLRDDVSSNPAKFCPSAASAGPSDVDMTGSGDANSKDPGGYAFNVNLGDGNSPHAALKVRYACHALAGGVPDDTKFNKLGFAVVTTGGSTTGGVDNTLTSSNGSGVDLSINGTVYVAGRVSPGQIKKNLTISTGDFIEFDQGNLKNCQQNLHDVAPNATSGPIIVPTSTTYSATCGAETPLETFETTNLGPAPDAAPHFISYPLAPATETCRVFLPGTYTSAPNLLNPKGGGTPEANYFVSGQYNFDSIGNWTIDNKAILVGGTPGSGDQSQFPSGVSGVDKTGCKDFAGADATAIKTMLGLTTSPVGEWSQGTQFILGGTSTIDMKNGQLSLYTPPSGQIPASMIAVRTAGWTPTGRTDAQQGYTAWAGNQPAINFQGSGNNVGFISNGQILAPDAPVSLSGTNGTTAAARSGIVGKTVDVNATAAVSGGSFYFQPFGGGSGLGTPPERRTVKVVACADSNAAVNCLTAPTSSTFTETAIATIDNFGTRPIRIFSWRAN